MEKTQIIIKVIVMRRRVVGLETLMQNFAKTNVSYMRIWHFRLRKAKVKMYYANMFLNFVGMQLKDIHLFSS